MRWCVRATVRVSIKTIVYADSEDEAKAKAEVRGTEWQRTGEIDGKPEDMHVAQDDGDRIDRGNES